MNVVLLIATIFAAACQTNEAGVSVTQQEKRVLRAKEDLEKERRRLSQLQDSLSIKIQLNVDQGMSSESANAVEQGMIDIHKAVVEAAETNLTTQKELLGVMSEHSR